MVRSEFVPVWLLTILVYLLKLLYVNSCVVWRSYGPLYVFIHFSPAFCAAHCALDLARDHAPQKCPLLLLEFSSNYFTNTAGAAVPGPG